MCILMFVVWVDLVRSGRCVWVLVAGSVGVCFLCWWFAVI